MMTFDLNVFWFPGDFEDGEALPDETANILMTKYPEFQREKSITLKKSALKFLESLATLRPAIPMVYQLITTIYDYEEVLIVVRRDPKFKYFRK